MRLTVNGIEREGSFCTVSDVREKWGKQRDVTILNGYQTEEDLPVHPNDTLTFIQKGVLPPEKELESMMAARHTPQVHEQVKKGRVAVAGLGGLGSHIAVMLARTGVGYLRLVDYDVVEPSNLNRQCYTISHLGQRKTEALAQQIREINPYITVETQPVKVTKENVSELFSGCSILCEAFDRPEEKAMLVNTALEELPKTKIVSASGMAGYGSANTIRTEQRMKNLYVCGDMQTEAQIGCGLMAPRVQICAGHQANMVLRLLLGYQEV